MIVTRFLWFVFISIVVIACVDEDVNVDIDDAPSNIVWDETLAETLARKNADTVIYISVHLYIVEISDTLYHTGIVKFYNEDKGFGYIIESITNDELYIYDEFLIDEVIDGDSVVFKCDDSRKGLFAYDVKILK